MVAGLAGELGMPGMPRASGMEVSEPRPAKQGQAETTHQQPNSITHLLTLTYGGGVFHTRKFPVEAVPTLDQGILRPHDVHTVLRYGHRVRSQALEN